MSGHSKKYLSEKLLFSSISKAKVEFYGLAYVVSLNEIFS
jgi:hypothetical protein